MGYMRHHAIVVTSWKRELLEEAHAKAVELDMSVSEITKEVTNGYQSFFVAPDGSKEGWDTSDHGDERREALTDWLDEQSGWIDWVEVSYGGDDYDRVVVERHPHYRDEE